MRFALSIWAANWPLRLRRSSPREIDLIDASDNPGPQIMMAVKKDAHISVHARTHSDDPGTENAGGYETLE